MCRTQCFFVGKGNREVALGTGDTRDQCAVTDVDRVFLEFGIPSVDDVLARAGTETHRAPQRQYARLRHDVFALLIFVNRVGSVLFALQKHMRNFQLRRVCRRGKPGRAGADDGDFE